MTNTDMSERDVERILRGERVESAPEAVAAVAAIAGLGTVPAEDRSARAGAALATVAAAQSAPVARRVGRSPWRARAAVAGALALVSAGIVGGAAAADEAAPGDALYELDRALEVVGLNDGGAEERLVEAAQLETEGDTEAALELIEAEAAAESDSSSSEALLAAAARIRENGSEQSAAVHARVAAKLEWKATTDAKGKEFGQGVAERAKAGKGEIDDASESVTEDDAPGTSGDAPGRSGEAPGQLKDKPGKGGVADDVEAGTED